MLGLELGFGDGQEVGHIVGLVDGRMLGFELGFGDGRNDDRVVG
jgi:hypothetical protein